MGYIHDRILNRGREMTPSENAVAAAAAATQMKTDVTALKNDVTTMKTSVETTATNVATDAQNVADAKTFVEQSLGATGWLTPITTLTGTSGTVTPGWAYTLAFEGEYTLNVSGAVAGKRGAASIHITPAVGATLVLGDGLSLGVAPTEGKLNKCYVEFEGLEARLVVYEVVE